LQQVVQDVNGNVIGLFTGSTSLTERETYTPWGALESGVITTLADTNRLRWKGLVWEGDSTQLYYVRARWYDPVSRRFVSEDPLGIDGGSNPYVYGGSNPVTHSDPSGMLLTDDLCYFGWETCPPMDSDPFLGNGGYGPLGDQAYKCNVLLLGALECLQEATDFVLSGVEPLGVGWSFDQATVLMTQFDASFVVTSLAVSGPGDWPSLFGYEALFNELRGCPTGRIPIVGTADWPGVGFVSFDGYAWQNSLYKIIPGMVETQQGSYWLSLHVTGVRHPTASYVGGAQVDCNTGASFGFLGFHGYK
jgi:RHS repeat-associated protein